VGGHLPLAICGSVLRFCVVSTSRTARCVVLLLFCAPTLTNNPDYYRQTPPKVPNFMRTLFRRKLVLWFLASEILRDYWLSGPYGRNWSFLWSAFIPKWAILLLVLIFFIGVWWLMLSILTNLTKTHTWFLPVFAVGLGAPRWCQMLWGTSSLALYIPWAGKAGPYLGTALWLWLGVLDAIQGVRLGMILLQVSYAFSLISAGQLKKTPTIDTIAASRVCYIGVRTADRMYLCDGRSCNGAKPNWSRVRVPRRVKMGLFQGSRR